MINWWQISVVALWVLTFCLAFLALAILRQLGLVYIRLGGGLGARQTLDGPELGQLLALPSQYSAEPGSFRLLPPRGSFTIILFASPTCSVCDPFIPHLSAFARSIRRTARFTVVLNGEDKVGKFASVVKHGVGLVEDGVLHEALLIPALPYGIVIDHLGRLLSKGTVNNVVQLESLLNQALAEGTRVQPPETMHVEQPA